MKGYALAALYPGIISFDELLPMLTPPKRRNLYGAYKHFLHSVLPVHLKPEHLVSALDWLRGQRVGATDTLHPFTAPANAILELAWQHLDAPGVLAGLVGIAMVQIEDYRPDLPFPKDESESDAAKRRRVAEAMLATITDDEESTLWKMTYSSERGMAIVRTADLDWLWERLTQCTPDERSRYAALLRRVCDLWKDDPFFHKLCAEYYRFPELRQSFGWLMEPVALDSAEAKMEREWHEQSAQLDKLEPKVSVEERQTRLREQIVRFEAGETDAWWRLFWNLAEESNGFISGNLFFIAINETVGWREANDATRTRLLDVAEKYLAAYIPVYDWIGSDTFRYPESAAFLTIDLLSTERPTFVDAMPAELWRKWSPAVIGYDLTQNSGALWKRQIALVRRAFALSPNESMDALRQLLLVHQERRDYSPSLLESAEEYMTPSLADAFLSLVESGQITQAAIIATILGKTAVFASTTPDANEITGRVTAFAEQVLDDTDAARDVRLAVARTLLYITPTAGWETAWHYVILDNNFGKSVIESGVGYTLRHSNFLSELTEQQLADLYRWLVRNYPPAEDPQHDGMYTVTMRDEMVRFRDSVLSYLRGRGTLAACDALRRLMIELPKIEWLPYILAECEEVARRAAWKPLEPKAILQLVRDARTRLVENADHLLALVVESLDRLQNLLQGTTPQNEFLWDGKEPKTENSISNYVKRHLEQDIAERGIVLAREVEIKQSGGSAAGQRVDIYVVATRRLPNGTHDTVTVLVEVKGCWNSDLWTALENQLTARYLTENGLTHGIYLVVWFRCPYWDAKDWRYSNTPNISVVEARTRLADQAARVTTKTGTYLSAVVLDATR